MFKMKKNEQNENILYLKGIRKFWIMFTIFKFLVQKAWNKTQVLNVKSIILVRASILALFLQEALICIMEI